MSATLSLEVVGLAPALAFLNRIEDPRRGREALTLVGGLVESQTRNRIAHEKRAPDGTAWAVWSPRYAASRHKGHSLLQASGSLLDSIAAVAAGDEEQVGSNLVYAAIQQAGGTADMPARAAAVPARPYLGLSDENVAEINVEMLAWLKGVAR